MKYLGFKKPPIILLKLNNERWTTLFFQIEQFKNGYYDVYYDADIKNYEITGNWVSTAITEVIGKLDKNMALLNLRNPALSIAYICQEIIFNNNEAVTDE
jgi:hypothetical protein